MYCKLTHYMTHSELTCACVYVCELEYFIGMPHQWRIQDLTFGCGVNFVKFHNETCILSISLCHNR